MVTVIDNNPSRGKQINSYLRRYGIYSINESYAETLEGFECIFGSDNKNNRYTLQKKKKRYVPSMIMMAVVPTDLDQLFKLFRYTIQSPDTVIMVVSTEIYENDSDTKRLFENYAKYIYMIEAFEENPISIIEYIYDILRTEYGILRQNVHINRLTIELNGHVYVNGRELMLTANEFSIVRFIAVNHLHSYNRAEIMNYCFEKDWHQGAGVIATHINHINEKSMETAGYRIIENKRGRGYYISSM